jgi:hypothetical protein
MMFLRYSVQNRSTYEDKTIPRGLVDNLNQIGKLRSGQRAMKIAP